MGNCSPKGVAGEHPNNVRIRTDSGDIIKLKGPRLAKDVLVAYPGYGIFRQGHALSSPLSSHEYLMDGQFYHLHPLEGLSMLSDIGVTDQVHEKQNIMSIESPTVSSRGAAAPNIQNDGVVEPALQVLPSQGNGVWKVKLVIKPKQLEEILSEEGNTEALIEKMRMAAAGSSGSSATAQRRSKSSWGMAWKPCIANAF